MNTMRLDVTYGRAFFENQASGSDKSAFIVAPILLSLLPPIKSMIDIGCGVGAWVRMFRKCGVLETIGVDGDYVDAKHRLIPQRDFVSCDLFQPLNLPQRFDLCISLEVAEHLPPERAESFIADLTGLAPFVLFSAAVPGQGGTNHLNEQWPEYWVEIFSRHGYRVIDCIRPRIWHQNACEYWYRQNTFLFVSNDVDLVIPHIEWPLARVHPDILSVRPVPTIRNTARKLIELCKDAIRNQIHRSH